MSRIVVTGMGVISSIGNNVFENRQALINGACGISNQCTTINSKYINDFPCGYIHLTNDDILKKLNSSRKDFSRTSLLALHAFNEAITDRKLNEAELTSSSTALIIANTVGGMCLSDELYQDSKTTLSNSIYLNNYDNASIAFAIQESFELNGFANTINTACSSSANAIIYAANLLKNKWAKIAIVGGVDSLSKFTINGFNALHILSREKCKPFSNNRNGLNLGEGAAFLILEREDDIQHENVYAVVSGYSNNNDAFHPSSLSNEADGPYLSMCNALKAAALNPTQIDFINAHGTGTENNDFAESWAMNKLFHSAPDFASTKANTGHTLGASGAIEAIYSILNIVHQEVYPSVNFDEPMAETGLTPLATFQKKSMNHVMSNSFGFGGNCASLIFSKR